MKIQKRNNDHKEQRCVICHKLLLNQKRPVCIRCNLKCQEMAEKAAVAGTSVAVVVKKAPDIIKQVGKIAKNFS